MERARHIRKGKYPPDVSLQDDWGLSYPLSTVLLVKRVLERSNWQCLPYPGGLFAQPAALMSDVLLLYDIEAYQEQMEMENGDNDETAF